MPLPHITHICSATSKRSGERCRNPVKGPTSHVCRMHGWRSQDTVRAGETHPHYRHGECTLEAKEELKELSCLKKCMKALGLIK